MLDIIIASILILGVLGHFVVYYFFIGIKSWNHLSDAWKIAVMSKSVVLYQIVMSLLMLWVFYHFDMKYSMWAMAFTYIVTYSAYLLAYNMVEVWPGREAGRNAVQDMTNNLKKRNVI